MPLWGRRVGLAMVGMVLLASARLSATVGGRPATAARRNASIKGSVRLNVLSAVDYSWLYLTVNAKNDGTTSVSFGFHIPCEDEIKLYRSAAHSGPPLHFRPGTGQETGQRKPGTPPGRVDITLAPGQEHTEDCGQFSLDDVVQEDERPAPAGVYYVVLDLGRSTTGQLLTVNAGIIVVGTSMTDPRDRGPLESRLTGTSALVDSA